MEQIKIIFYALASFFAIENGRFAAEKTTVTIDPKQQQIEIIQEGLFTVIQSEKDSILALEQWNKIQVDKEKNIPWAKALDSFSIKNFTFTPIKKTLPVSSTTPCFSRVAAISSTSKVAGPSNQKEEPPKLGTHFRLGKCFSMQ